MDHDPGLIKDDLMSRRNFLAVCGAIAAAVALAACSSGSGPEPAPSISPATSRTPSLHSSPPEVLSPTTDPQLRLLQQYETETGVAPQMMIFIGFPENAEDARSNASTLAGTLQQWHAHGVKPLVIMEPTLGDGSINMDLHAFNHGKYDSALQAFWDDLAGAGITTEQMGTWVPFPESNQPNWANGGTDPELFRSNFTKVATAIKANFPGTPVSIMLDSGTSLKADYSDFTMDPAALRQYLVGFPKGLIDSFGLQGFSWDNQDDPSTYLSAEAAILAAQQLGVRHIWLNTGTYSKMNNPDGEGIITATNERRADLLKAVLEQATRVQAAGLTLDFINIFGQNNFDPKTTATAEFEYHTPAAKAVLKQFVHDAAAHNIPVLIFDAP